MSRERLIGDRFRIAAAAALPREVVATAQERGRARDLEVTVKELLVEFRSGL